MLHVHRRWPRRPRRPDQLDPQRRQVRHVLLAQDLVLLPIADLLQRRGRQGEESGSTADSHSAKADLYGELASALFDESSRCVVSFDKVRHAAAISSF